MQSTDKSPGRPPAAPTPPVPAGDIQDTRAASRRLVRELDMLKQRVGCAGVSYTEGHVLLHVENAGLLTTAELAGLLRLDRSTTSRAVQSLVRRGYLRTEKRGDDRRLKPVTLTSKGASLVERIHRMANAEVEEALALLTPEQRRTVIDGMHAYAKALHRSLSRDRHKIRRIRRRDNPFIARVIHRVMTDFELDVPGTSLHDDEVGAMCAAYAGKRAAYFVVVDGDTVVGGAGIAPLRGADETVCELRKMYLLPEARGLGLGARLLERCLEAARAAGYETCYLETIPEMKAARALYEKFGFERLERPMGATGHFRCDRWLARSLAEA